MARGRHGMALDRSSFEYDHTAPLELEVHSANARDDGALVQDVHFNSPRGGRVPAYLIFSSAQPPQAAVLFGHWGEGDRTEFVEEAALLTHLGLASLCIDAPFRRPSVR